MPGKQDSKRKVDVVICWHMHQPCYRVRGRFVEPWVYLHAIKDYGEMAAHLETVDGARAVVNFVPVLLDQIEQYRVDLDAYLQDGSTFSDPLLQALADGVMPQEATERVAFIRRCFQANEHRVVARFPAYQSLRGFGSHVNAETASYLSDGYLYDALVWFHLAWLGEHRRDQDPRAQRLLAKQRGFSVDDGRALLELIRDEIAGVIPRYRALAEAGRIELAVSPWAHPILPLLLDFGVARETAPHTEVPAGDYPSGRARAQWHLDEAFRSFERHFGMRPAGCWPPEGAISDETLALLDAAGFAWTASGGTVLHNSLAKHHQAVGCSHTHFEKPGLGIRCFFRDDELSDLIGFTYKDWAAADAVDDLVGRIEAIGDLCDRERPLVTIIMDGENAWEHYPHNAFDFLQLLYQRLASHPDLNLTTFSDRLNAADAEPLHGIAAGSWVYGNLTTWVGHGDKNRAWDLLLGVANRCGDLVLAPDHAELRCMLGICEGSDWFWWLGDHHAAETVARFDRLFREHLSEVYGLMSAAADEDLNQPISTGGDAAESHTMLPSQPR